MNDLSDLLRKVLKTPLEFTSDNFNELIMSYRKNEKYDVQKGMADFRKCVGRIYNLNEDRLKETSNANTGMLGKLNRRSTRMRQKSYFKKIEKQKPGKKYIRIYAEGDSWFLFPTFVKDVIDWLEKNDNYLIYSDAYGGDWITNIIYEGQYIEALTTHSPDVFLISGGGNDLVGNSRMAVMISNINNQQAKHTNETLTHIENEEERELILLAQKYITKDFYAFIWIMRAQYTLLFKGLYDNTTNFEKMISLTHGYAYPYPKRGTNFSMNLMQPIVNSFLNSGQWLFRPLMIKGIVDEKTQRAIVMTFIYEFNEMLKEVAKSFKKNVFHIDCRDIPKNQTDWYDELHLKNRKFKEVADRFKELIDREINSE